MAKTVFDVLKTEIEQEISSASDAITSGAAKDFPQYKELTGRIQGLRLAMRLISDLAKNYMDDDDE